MEPPNYREAKGWPGPCCQNCIHEVSHESRPVCIKYLRYLRLHRICDDWRGENPIRDQSGAVFGYYHSHFEGEDEKSYLNSQQLFDEEGWTPER
jgi:hypothetical protein